MQRQSAQSLPPVSRLVLPIMLVWMLAASLCLAADLLRGPYLQQATPDSIVIVWRTDDASDPVVRYGRSAASLDQHADGDAITRLAPEQLTLQDDLAASHPQLVKSPVATLATHQYEARLTRLEPETTYYYAVYDGQRRLAGGEDCFFTTPPRRGVSRPLRFWVIGDAGTGGSAQRRVFDAMRRYIDRTGRPLNLALYVGDIAYDHGTDEQFQHRYFEPYADLLRHTVMWGTMGNHEGFTSSGVTGTGPYYDAFVLPTQAEAGGIPSNTEAYYAFDYGPVHFISLNSYDIDRSPDGPMAQWLKRDLAQLGPDTRWLIAFWHHAPYSKGTHDSDTDREMTQMRENIMPILEDAGVDLVLTGHSHIYERSMLIDGAYATPTTARGVILDDGTGDPNADGPYRKSAGLNPHEGHVHVVSGHGGNSTFRIGTCPLMRVITTDHGSVIVDIDGDTLDAVMVDLHGNVRDRFQIVKRGRVQPRPVDNPWQPEDWFGTPPIADPIHLIAPRQRWQYLTGNEVPSDWTTNDRLIAPWLEGEAGLGYGDRDDQTDLEGLMRNRTTVLYLRRAFDVDQPQAIQALGLMVRYDDGFIAYLNGREVLRVGVESGARAQAGPVKLHEARRWEYFPIPNPASLLRPGRNILAIEAHNESARSSDLTIDPYLVASFTKDRP